MEIKLVGVYRDKFQRKYIITAFRAAKQQYNNLIFEELDQDSNFITHQGVSDFPKSVVLRKKSYHFNNRYDIKTFPTLVLVKNEKPIGYLYGKYDQAGVLQWLQQFPWLNG